jgi:hypothetical protein
MLWHGCHITRPSQEPLTLDELQEQLLGRLKKDMHLGQLDASPEPKGLVWTTSGKEPGHFGIVFTVQVPDNIAEFLDEKQFKTNGRGHWMKSFFVRPADLGTGDRGENDYTLEEWSRLWLEAAWLT